jgi:hypothetical protein
VGLWMGFWVGEMAFWLRMKVDGAWVRVSGG